MKNSIQRIGLVVAILGCLGACSGGDDGAGVEPVNRAPTISFIFDKIGVVRSAPVQLSVNVNDLDNDPLTLTWSVTRGTIAPLNTAKTLVQWNVPSAVGVDSITVTVSDGTASRTLVEGIKVGYPHTSITAPSVFMKSRSPYIVTLSSGVVLAVTGETTIEPGTEILLETTNMVIDVTDTLLAVGAPFEPIVIQPNRRHLTCGDDRGWWEGIKVSTDAPSNGNLKLENATIAYAQYGIRLRDNGTAFVNNSQIRCSGQNGILHEGGGALVVKDSEVINGRFDGIAITSDTFSPDSVLIDRCTIQFNGRTGIALDLMDAAQAVEIAIQYSDIRFNAEHGITLDNAVFPEIHYNFFFGNGAGSQFQLNSIWLFSGYPGGVVMPQLDASCNFWGAPVTNVSTIEALVRDQQDTGTVGTDVIVSPWSNENPLTGSSSCVWP